jgi:DNA-binding GntR family transcriptional regulator
MTSSDNVILPSSPRQLAPVPADSDVPLTSSVHDRLREAILRLELEPGRRISQLELTRQLEVSRTPLREALRLLEREGLIEPSSPHGLVTIAPLRMDDLEDLYSLRVMGESLALWLTVPLLDKGACRQLSADLKTIDKAESAERRRVHQQFHDHLRIGAGERMRRELRQLFEHAERYQLALTRRQQRGKAQSEHRAILRACRAGDRVQAARLLADHIAGTAYGLLEVEAPGRPTPGLDAAVVMAHEGLARASDEPA